ncbi:MULTISPECIES: polysaccharide biosynthesis/export family protein [unclassified Sphingomonas]|uniref:polysaccharide biosynthesis/export family protein n=1 Tax=unclassified Sphingomonas TaxID=196159 RepID=UPI0028610ED6|nr:MULTISPECIES: polysaccharide biosynthesis/export family protein [unclassified Sphingomonas]MDR6116753.1 polysaccharide export outer membrane protein [Sphingomonas sp. SORGH_AS_0789]MDR6151909.1 polysaccharide export outer membrane protein [Sphingomonas sp. SORGH_AS_0742]
MATVDAMNGLGEAQSMGASTLASLYQERRVDLIGPGDVLTITIYEVGVSLFGGGVRAAPGGFDPSAHGETFPDTVVDAKGQIDLPYLGPISVAGLTVDQAQRRIAASLRGKSQDPRVLVAVRQNVANTIYVSGAVNKPGRIALTLGREHLLDAIASAGGSANSADDTVIRFVRGDRIIEQRLGTIRSNSADDLVLSPGDRIELIRRPRTYTVFGAVLRISQIPFETGEVSLAEALARSGGPNDAQANPSAIFLFRYNPVEGTQSAEPIIYRLNMLKPESYFLAQRFAMRDKDVIYIANASANQPAKAFGIINQLFAPFITARQITR